MVMELPSQGLHLSREEILTLRLLLNKYLKEYLPYLCKQLKMEIYVKSNQQEVYCATDMHAMQFKKSNLF